MHLLSQAAYRTIAGHTGNDRQVERRLFEQVTAALMRVQAAASPQPTDRVEAVYRNSQLWTLLTADLLNPDNALPLGLKTGLLGLAGFVRAETQRALASSVDLSDLIQINQSVLAGLSGQLPAQSPEVA